MKAEDSPAFHLSDLPWYGAALLLLWSIAW
jgi:hypothetical protein